MSFERPPSLPQENPETEAVREKEVAFRRFAARIRKQLETFDEQGLAYHNSEHTEKKVLGGSRKLAEAAFPGNSTEEERNRYLVEVGALGHDYDQDFEWVPAPSGVGEVRKRYTGVIELRSAEDTIRIALEEGVVLQPEDQELVREIIRGTVPQYNPDLRTVIQPNVTKDSHLAVWCVAIADIASAGLDAEQFLRDGDAVFCEDRKLPPLSELFPEEKEVLLQEVRTWNANQVSYASGQKERFSQEDVPKVFLPFLTEFDASIEAAKERAEKRSQMSLEEVLTDMQYSWK